MNTQLIPVFAGELSGAPAQLVDARLLHGFLESAQDFSDWIKKRIKAYSFVENQDYLLHKFMEQLPSGAKAKIDYHLTLDMAKELSMVERNEKGRQARRYFIDMERLAHGQLHGNAVQAEMLYVSNVELADLVDERVKAMQGELLDKPEPQAPALRTKILHCIDGDLVSQEIVPYGCCIVDPKSPSNLKTFIQEAVPMDMMPVVSDALFSKLNRHLNNLKKHNARP